MLQICCLSSAVQQHFQILPKEGNTVFLMKWAVLAPVIFIHYFQKNAVIVAVAQSSNRMYFHVKQNHVITKVMTSSHLQFSIF